MTEAKGFSKSSRNAVRTRLLEWYKRHKRDLPWRRTRFWYPVLVSEIMLQQTQVKTVLPYYERWMQTFPDPSDLAAAEETQVLSLWSGLGYYSRARNLQKTVRQILEDQSSGLPKTQADWRQYTGVGSYTAAAVASISFNDPAAVADGNVVRVLFRLLGIDDALTSAGAVKKVQPIAQDLLDPECPGDFNQAVMELGATVCHKHKPACLLCPLTPHCQAYLHGTTGSIPSLVRNPTRKRSVDKIFWVRGDSVLLQTFPAGSQRLEALSELPDRVKFNQIPSRFLKQDGKRARGISNERIEEILWRVDPDYPASDPLPAGHIWVKIEELDKVPLSGPHRKWLHELLKSS